MGRMPHARAAVLTAAGIIGCVRAPDYDAWTAAFTRLAEDDPRVVAAVLVGSRAAGTADRYSDLDVHLVTTDAAYEDVLAQRDELVGRVGTPLLLENFGLDGVAFLILGDGAEVELNFVRASQLRLTGPYRVLVDKGDVVRRVTSTPESGSVVQVEAIRRQVTWFWHDLSHFITAVGRGKLIWAYGQLDDLRRYCLDLARLAHDPTAEPEAYWKGDDLVRAGDRAVILDSMVPPERDAMLRSAESLMAFYRQRAKELAAAHGVPYPDQLDRIMTERLEELQPGA